MPSSLPAFLSDPATLLLIAAGASCLAVLLALVLLLRGRGTASLETEIQTLRAETARQSEFLREAVVALRADGRGSATELRGEVVRVMQVMGDGVSARLGERFETQDGLLGSVRAQIADLTAANERRQLDLQTLVDGKLTEMRGESGVFMRDLNTALANSLKQMGEDQRERLQRVAQTVTDLTQAHKAEQESLRAGVENRLEALRAGNEQKLEQMRQTVDEKLQKTLHERVSASFAAVGEQLERVHRSVGEMQSLATGVGDLKRVLTNVKTRGTFGEIGLGALLEETLTADQFARNVEVRPGSGERVEFAIRLPGPDEDGPLWLPIDCKFPTAEYERLSLAVEAADAARVEEAARGVELAVRNAAKTIAQKYLAPPHSTDFGILFLPTEGLYAEVVRRPGLVDLVQREHRILIAGPTTLWALLSSLRMGFRTLAIQQRSGEVWQVLGAVKGEFGKFGEALEKVRQRLDQAGDEIDKVAVRRRAMDRRLRQVDQLPDAQYAALLGLDGDGLRLVSGETMDESAA